MYSIGSISNRLGDVKRLVVCQINKKNCVGKTTCLSSGVVTMKIGSETEEAVRFVVISSRYLLIKKKCRKRVLWVSSLKRSIEVGQLVYIIYKFIIYKLICSSLLLYSYFLDNVAQT